MATRGNRKRVFLPGGADVGVCCLCGARSHRKDWKFNLKGRVACDHHDEAEFVAQVTKDLGEKETKEAQVAQIKANVAKLPTPVPAPEVLTTKVKA